VDAITALFPGSCVGEEKRVVHTLTECTMETEKWWILCCVHHCIIVCCTSMMKMAPPHQWAAVRGSALHGHVAVRIIGH